MRMMTIVSGLVLATGFVLSQPTAASLGPTVSIEGAVVNAGTFDLETGSDLGDLILAAGKMTLLADTERVELRRKGEAPRRLELSKLFAAGEPKLELAPGDHIIVPEHKDRVLLIGVPGGGYRPVVPGQRVSDFFAIAENFSILDTTKIDLGKTTLERKGKPAVSINLKKILKNPRDKQNVQLESGDVIWLEPREPTAFPLQGAALRGMSAAHIREKAAAQYRRAHAGNAKTSCCLSVPCNEVGNAGFFTVTRKAGWLSAFGNCDHGSCCGH
jgi:protein involved in polysaccharide export with SLBB domain